MLHGALCLAVVLLIIRVFYLNISLLLFCVAWLVGNKAQVPDCLAHQLQRVTGNIASYVTESYEWDMANNHEE